MEKDMQLGPETDAKIIVSGGVVRMQIDYVGKQMKGGAYAEMSPEAYGQMLKDAIPGKIDDAIIDVIIAALKVV